MARVLSSGQREAEMRKRAFAAMCPKIMETFGGDEITNLRASFMLVGTDAKADIPLPETVRRYFSRASHTAISGPRSTTRTPPACSAPR